MNESRRWFLIDVVVACGGVALAAWSLTTIFADAMGVRAVLGGVLVPALALLLSRRFSAWLRVGIAAGATVVAAGPLVLPHTCWLGIVPTPSTLFVFVERLVGSWKDALTAAGQLSAESGTAVMAYVWCALMATAALHSALSRRWWPAVVPLLLLTQAVANLWSDVGVWVPASATLAAGVLVWGAARRRHQREGVTAASAVAAAPPGGGWRVWPLVLASAGLACALLAVAILPAAPRVNLRGAVPPPMDVRQATTPLASFRYLSKEMADKPLFTVSQVPPSGRIRLAALDAYDGRSFGLSREHSRFLRTSSHAPTSGLPAYRFQIEEYRGIWRPGAGEPSSMQIDSDQPLFVGESAQTLMSPQQTTAGQSYTVAMRDTVVVGGTSMPIAAGPVPSTENVPDVVATKAADFAAGALDPWSRLERIAGRLRAEGMFAADGDTSARGGHSAARINTLLTSTPMVGDDEQFAVAMTLMARALGIPARVAMGFAPTPGSPTTVRGKDVRVWVEVPVAGERWAAFDPAPPRDRIAPSQRSSATPRPTIRQAAPPEPAREVPEDRSEGLLDEARSPLENSGAFPWPVVWILAGLLVVVGPVAGIVGLKRWRRRRRQTAPPSQAVVNAWREACDRAVDFGAALPPGSATRSEVAHALMLHYPQADWGGLASAVDALAFGPEQPTPDDVAAIWSRCDATTSALRSSHGGTSRLRAQCSLRSWRGHRMWGRSS